MSSMFITAAGMLAAFDISKPVDENGMVVEPKVEYINNIQKCVSSFLCVLSEVTDSAYAFKPSCAFQLQHQT